MNQYFDLDKGKNVTYVNDCSSTSGYSSANSPTSVTLSPAHSPETMLLQSEFANLNLPTMNVNSPLPLPNSPYQQQQQNQLLEIGGNDLLSRAADFGNMYMDVDHPYYAAQPPSTRAAFGQIAVQTAEVPVKTEYKAVLRIVEQPVEKFRFRYKSEMHGTHGSLNGANSKRTPKTFPEVELSNYDGPAVVRCSLFQTNLDSPHSHQLVVRKDERDVCDPHDLYLSPEIGYVAQFMNMGIIHTAKKYIFDELLKKKEDRLVFQMGRREISTKQKQELHQETEREAKDMNLNQVRLCFEAFKIEENKAWTPIAAPVFSNAINNRKSAQTGELRIVRLSKPTGSVMGNDELILLVEKVSKKNIKVRFFEENDDGDTIWEAYAKFRESDVHHQYAIVCQTPAYKDKNIDQDVSVCIELIRPSDDERSYPSLPFRYKPCEAIASRKRRRTGSAATSSSSTSSSQSSQELPKVLQQHGIPNTQQNALTISQEFGRDCIDKLINSEEFHRFCNQDSEDLVKCYLGALQEDGHGKADSSTLFGKLGKSQHSSNHYFAQLLQIHHDVRQSGSSEPSLYASSRKKVEDLFLEHAARNYNNDTLLHEVISQKQDNLKLALPTFQVIKFFALQEMANTVNAQGDSGLHFACQQDRAHYIRPLLGLGCNPNNQNHVGNTALHLAVKEERIGCIKSFLNTPGIKLDITLKNDDGLTPLHMAIRQNKYDVAKKLINHDRSAVNVSNTKDGNNALHMAVLEQNVELLVLILDAQNVTDILLARNAAGYTPLELARSKANKACVKLLEAVYPDGADTAIIKEEVCSSSEEDDEESNDAPIEQKTDKLKTEKPVPMVEHTDQVRNLRTLLSDEKKFSELAAMLNKPSSNDPKQPKWKLLAKESKMNQLIFIWPNAENMLRYVMGSDSAEDMFMRALQRIDRRVYDALTQD